MTRPHKLNIMLYIALNNLLLCVIAHHTKIGSNVPMSKLNNLTVLSSLIKSYLAKDKSSNKVKDSVCLALAKLISVVVLNNSTMASLDLLLNNSQVKSILTNHCMDFELENLHNQQLQKTNFL